MCRPQVAFSQVHAFSRHQMGTRVQILVWSSKADLAAVGADRAFAEIARIENLMSEWKTDSEISKVNREAAARAIKVGPDLYRVLARGVAIAKASGGAFDISWAALRGVWDFQSRSPKLPSKASLSKAVALVDYRRIHLNRQTSTVRLGQVGMSLGLGGIAKGYGVDRAAATLETAGFHDFVVSAGGDMLTRGSKGGKPWIVGVQHPRAKAGTLLARVAAQNEAVVTSGDYERFVTIDGKRYHHILNLRTGMPSRGSMSVTVLSPNATDADALCTAAFVMGPQKGLAFLEAQVGVEGLIVDAEGRTLMTSGASKRITVIAAPL